MSPRPAPQYGEFATPDEVREALGQPQAPDPAHRIAGEELSATPSGDAMSTSPAASTPVVAPVVAPVAASATAPTDPRVSSARRWDQFVTVALLVMGMWNVIFGAPGMLAFDQAMRSYFTEVQGVPDATFGEPTRIIGQVMAAALITVLVACIWFSWRRVRAARIAFWVPLVGAGAALAIMLLGVVALLALEPGLYEAVAAIQTPVSTG